MKKYLVQFCEELSLGSAPFGKFNPQYIPTKGIIAEFSHEKISDLMESVFDRYPKYHIAIVSEIEAGKNGKVAISEFKFIAVNQEWNGKKATGYAVDIPADMFKMMG